jgi:hypothetical protein
MQVKVLIAAVLALLVVLLSLLAAHGDAAMQECERAYSHDVCFEILNN